MTVARMDDGALVVFSAIALNEAEMRALDAWGRRLLPGVPGDLQPHGREGEAALPPTRR